MKYVVIKVRDREIANIGVANTPVEATAIMKNDLMNAFLDHYYKEEFEDSRDDVWGLDETYAWLNTNSDIEYNWQIICVE